MDRVELDVLLKGVFFFLLGLQALGTCINGSNCCYMVVFQYGSIVLFNVREHEVNDYLKIVRNHASGLLPEMRKDGEFFFFFSVYCVLSIHYCKAQENF